MKFSEHWLRSFVNPLLDTRGLADALTFAGLEVETIEPVAPRFERVVVGEVLSVEKHPGADKLSLCQVNVGVAPLAIVCGAPNMRAGMKAPTALIGAKLPGIEIKAAKVRGIESHGMLCSEKELGLSADAAGLMTLPADAPIGADVREVLGLEDSLLTTKPTPNRGDCLSILGIAREVAAITGATLTWRTADAAAVLVGDRLDITLEAPEACPRYCGRIVRDVNVGAPTPQWMKSRLERSGLRSVSAIVDVTNYVMLELGQPLHAFDAGTLQGGIHVGFARTGEKFELLNGETPALGPDYLVIADERKAVALAGIMGGAATAVSPATRDIFLESAFFAPSVIAGKSRVLGFGSDSAFRFERGVDFDATRRALERATELVLQICGGRCGPVSESCAPLPPREPVTLRSDRVERVLGIKLDPAQVSDIFRRLGFTFQMDDGFFSVTPPSYRFDISLEEDLIEELARINGYENIPAVAPVARSAMLPSPEATRARSAIRSALVRRDYHEVVTYSFVDSRSEADLCGNSQPIALANPIASQMNVMRSSLFPGLIDATAFNARHKQNRVRLFEIGRCFLKTAGDYEQPVRIGGAAYGDALPEQWGERGRRVDFYDVKSDLESLFAPREIRCEAAAHPALHPGKSARVVVDSINVGWIGELHPQWQRKYELPLPPVLFELEYDAVAHVPVPVFGEVPKVPPVRRDFAALFDESLSHQAIIDALWSDAPAIVTDVRLFDVYRGSDLEKGKKSLAFRVLLQDTRKTLTDAEVESAVAKLREVLHQRFGAKLR